MTASWLSWRNKKERHDTRYNSGMKQLLRKPLSFAFLLSLPLWIVFSNYIVAITVALLVAFLASMCHSLYLMNRKKKP